MALNPAQFASQRKARFTCFLSGSRENCILVLLSIVSVHHQREFYIYFLHTACKMLCRIEQTKIKRQQTKTNRQNYVSDNRTNVTKFLLT